MPVSAAAAHRRAEMTYTARDEERHTPEAPKPFEERSAFEIDRARILHSAAFRRLQRKTQVFASTENDFSRTRLTHSLEVSQVAKGIAIRLGADPTLCEAAALAHDIGHPPFGHAGERVLHACMREAGGFEGNAQNLRVLATLEVKTDYYDGLNLTRATLDSVLKYKLTHSEAARRGQDKFCYDEDAPLVDWVCQGRRDETRTSFECQIMDWADDVAYSVHDMEDGIQAGLVTTGRLQRERTIEFVRRAVPEAEPRFLSEVVSELGDVLRVQGERSRKAARKSWASKVIHELVSAVDVDEADDLGLGSRYAWRLTVTDEARLKSRLLMALAYELVFQAPGVASVQPRAERVLRGLFDILVDNRDGDLYPEDFRERLGTTERQRFRVACDFIASMTDTYAEQMYERLLG